MPEQQVSLVNLSRRLLRQISQDGPISVAHYMTLCLLDPRHGYYPTRDPIGAGADFITAPEISQIFGELVGIWLANCWQAMANPKTTQLVELGPGKGTMMSDILRTARSVPEFSKSIQVHLLEASAALVAVQAKTLGSFAQTINWTDDLNDTGSGPLLLVANEYLDCLPVRQFVRKNDFWFERLIGLSETNELQFTLSPTPLAQTEMKLIPPNLLQASDNTLVEIRSGLSGFFDPLAERAKTDPVIALFIDYGPASSQAGDSFQAVSKHQKVDPLKRAGEVDLTAQVDFTELKRMAEQAGLLTSNIVTQGSWLQQMGLLERAAALSSGKLGARAKIARQVHRLSDDNEMGELFKVMAVYSKGISMPVGFDV
ncbi:MAG: SAM-dependent methyltransferase [Robiginitomaculum sp.]|nr:SAM-dependent methyltransferase [Robiginitomaculum sp.]